MSAEIDLSSFAAPTKPENFMINWAKERKQHKRVLKRLHFFAPLSGTMEMSFNSLFSQHERSELSKVQLRDGKSIMTLESG